MMYTSFLVASLFWLTFFEFDSFSPRNPQDLENNANWKNKNDYILKFET